MSKFNYDKKKDLKEDDCAPTPSVPGGAYPSCGVFAPYQTLTNTIGIGNPVMGGSDRYDNIVGQKKKKKKR